MNNINVWIEQFLWYLITDFYSLQALLWPLTGKLLDLTLSEDVRAFRKVVCFNTINLIRNKELFFNNLINVFHEFHANL